MAMAVARPETLGAPVGLESALIQECRQGDPRAFARLVQVHERLVYGLAARLLGDAEEAHKRFYDGYEALQPEDIADSIAFAVGSPARMNVSFMEVLPTLQVVGGLNFARGPTKSGQQA